MLAESRKRRKNPIHSISLSAPNHWTNDDSKFGQKMLEKMGWSKGLGLGKNNQGIAENIKVLHKVTPTGLGFVKHNAEDWFKAGDDYARLLAQLTQTIDNDQSTSDCKHDVTSKKSLMENSLNSRSRVHYHKFTRGKDLTKYKSEELACILGKGIKETGPASTSLNMNEYFKTKRKSKNLSLNENESNVVDVTTSQDIVTEEENYEHDSQNVISKSKNLKSKSPGENEEEILDTNEQDSPISKKRKLEQTLDQNKDELDLEETNSKAESSKKKKNCKKNKKQILSKDDFINREIQFEDQFETNEISDDHKQDLSSSKKNNTEKILDSEVDETITLDTSNLKSDSSKKKKSSKKINSFVNHEHQNQIITENEINVNLEGEHSKKKKRKCIINCESNPSEKKLEENSQVINKKKKSKSKVKDEVHSDNETNLSDKNDDKVKNTEIKSEDSFCNNVVSEENVEPGLEKTDLTHKYQTLVDLLVENSSAGKKYCKGETPADFEEQIKEFIESVKEDPKATVASTHKANLSINGSVSDSKSTNLNPDDKNFIQEFELQKNKMLTDKAKYQGVSKFVNDKTKFVTKHGKLLFFGSNLNDIKGYGEF